MSWARSAAQLEALREADYPFPEPSLKLLGTVIQRYRLKGGRPTEAFRDYFRDLDEAVNERLVPALTRANVLLAPAKYREAGLEEGLRLASIPDFNTLIANSQQVRKPVFTLTREDVNRGGFVWDTQKLNIDSFRAIFEEMALRIESLTAR